MLVDAKFGRCILCAERPPDSREHLIPACVGGSLEALILCAPCNGHFGTSLVSQLKTDPSIRMAVANLRDRIPALAAQFEEGLDFVAEGKDGVAVVVSQKRGRWKTRAMEASGNSLVLDTEDTATYIRNRLRKQGLSEVEAESWVNRFGACENGEKLRLPTGDALVKNEATVRLPKLTGRFVDDRVPTLIAFEFLALCLGEPNLGPEFDPVRDYIRKGRKTNAVQVVSRTTRRYNPTHTLRLRVKHRAVTILVQFFGWYVFEVNLRGIPIPPKEIVYVEDLETKQRLIALSAEDAEQGNWHVV